MGMIRTVAFAVLATLATPALTADLVVRYDPGGNVVDRWFRVQVMVMEQKSVAVVGECHSACTMYLGLDGVCTTRNAVWGFHGASAEGPQALQAEAYGNELLAASYPPNIRKLFEHSRVKLKSPDIYRVRGVDMIALGVRECQQ